MSENLEREPDGVPHDIVGRTMLAAYMLGGVVLATLATFGSISAVAVAVLALPIVVVVLRNRAGRERDHIHPSI
jgi:hypothetical protein